ncbi:Tli1 [Pseudomonas aeruginosa PAK]|nr:hypothetical protein Y880_03066 [Pseudomonas aeruginosa PAK]VUY43858.1 Tli1 [Pseudomonas aeruginosa PAK]
MNGRGIGLPALLPGPLLAAGCQSGPDMLAAPVMGYNHTSAAINWFSVNGAGGPRLGPYQGDGSQVCCGVIPKKWNPNLKAVVEWEKDPKPHAAIRRDKYGRLDKDDYLRHASSYTRHKMIVDVPRYSEKICLLQVHFLPCDQVVVSTTYYSQGHPEYPDRKYFQKRAFMQKLLNAKGLRTPVWLIALLIGFLFLQACQAGPDMVSTPIGGYNHNSAAINRFSVNGAGGLNLGPFQGEQGRYVVVSFLEFGSRA